MKATIKGVYTHSRDGKEYVTSNGYFFVKVLLSLEDGNSIYESFFFTQRAHFRFEDLFASAGQTAPNPSVISANHLNQLIGDEINIAVGKNKAGYDTVTKFYPAEKAAQPVTVDEQVPDEIAEQSADLDLDEDVPF